MTYDFHGAWAGFTAQNSPLYSSSSEGQWQADNLNCNSSITHWILEGAQPEKLTIGIAFYGKSFILSDPNNYGLGAPSSGPTEGGEYTKNIGTLGYNEICEFHSSGEILWDDEQQVPYLHDGEVWVGFDNPKSVALKVKIMQIFRFNNLVLLLFIFRHSTLLIINLLASCFGQLKRTIITASVVINLDC